MPPLKLTHPNRHYRLVVMEHLVPVVHGLVAPTVEHVVVDHAVGFRVHAGSHREVVDERLRGEHAAHVRRRRGRRPKPGEGRRHVGLHVVGSETVERHDHHDRVSADRRDRGRGEQAAQDRQERDDQHRAGHARNLGRGELKQKYDGAAFAAVGG